MSNLDIPSVDLERARSLYLSGMSIKQISELTNIKRTTLQYYVKKDWKTERELRETELLAKVSTSHSQMIANMTKHTIIALERAMVNLSQREEPPTSKEAMDMASVLEKIQKISDAYKKDEEPEDEEDYIDPFNPES